MIKVYLANLGKYNEGELVGEWLELPCTEEEMEQKLVEIGVAHYNDKGEFIQYVIETDAKGYEYVYEEYAIHDYEVPEGLDLEIGEYTNLNELNELAEKLDNLGESDMEVLKALVELGYMTEKDLYEKDLEKEIGDSCVIYLEDSFASDEQRLGEAYIEQVYGDVSNMDSETLARYFDFEAFGRDLAMDYSVASNNIAVRRY